MNETSSHNSANSTNTTTTISDWEKIPCVQYGFPEDKGPIRAPTLRTIFEPIPEDATTASPVYVLTREQYEDLQSLENPYQVENYTSIATKIQDQCEADDRVLYPIHIESDKFRDLGSTPLIEWFREFVETHLNVPYHTCQRYFSGNRSIHVHVPRFVSGEDQRKQLKKLAETFCEQADAELDCELYSPKRMFRLPGVEHEDTGVPKLKIEGKWDNAQLAEKIDHANPKIPESYAEVLQRVFLSQESLITSSPQLPLNDPFLLFENLDSDKTILEFETDEKTIETPLIEQEQYPEDSGDVVKWLQYNAKEFSPYASADEDGPSVAVLKIKGRPFARKERRKGASMIPAFYYGARGCNGEFTKDEEHAPLQLSKCDYRKWEYEIGDCVVIIGGRSRNSRIFQVDSWQATVAGHALTGEDASRKAALEYLEDKKYNIGKAAHSYLENDGKKGESVDQSNHSTTENNSSSKGATHIWPARENPQSEAEALQRKAEQEGIKTLTHHERIKVACRHLRQGWEPAWEWFQEQFGSEFKPQVTRRFFKGIIEDDSIDWYDHVEIPPG